MSLKVIKYVMKAIGAKPNGSAETWNVHVDAVRNASWLVTLIVSILVYLTALAATPFQVRAMKNEVEGLRGEQKAQALSVSQKLTEADRKVDKASARMDMYEREQASMTQTIKSIDAKLDILIDQGLSNAHRRKG